MLGQNRLHQKAIVTQGTESRCKMRRVDMEVLALSLLMLSSFECSVVCNCPSFLNSEWGMVLFRECPLLGFCKRLAERWERACPTSTFTFPCGAHVASQLHLQRLRTTAALSLERRQKWDV